MVTGTVTPSASQLVPSPGQSLATLTFDADQWAILSPPRVDTRLVAHAVARFLRDFGLPPDGPVEFRAVQMDDPLLGLAVLHASAAGTVVYCRRDYLGAEVARGLTAFARSSTEILLAASGPGRPPRTRFAVTDHAEWTRHSLPEPWPHPVMARIARDDDEPVTTVHACSCQMSPQLADVLTLLGCTRLRHMHAQRASRAATPAAGA